MVNGKYINDPSMQEVNIELLKRPNAKNTLSEAYNSLYNSLGVEPGLLSKTKMGRELNKKYRDDSVDAKIYSIDYIKSNSSSDIVDEILRTAESTHHDKIGKAPEIKDELWQIIRKIQLQDHLSNEMVVAQIQKYFDYIKEMEKNYG